MSEPAVQLKAVGAAREELHETARQALEWVRVSEDRVAAAEARLEKVRVETKQRAMVALRKIGAEGRRRIVAESQRAKTAEARAARAEGAFERARRDAEKDRESCLADMKVKHERAIDAVNYEADQRVAAAEQRAAEAEAAGAEAHELAVRLEAEIEERVMQGTIDVRREAEERVKALVEKVEGEAAEKARARAGEALKAESERIRVQAEQREQRVREAAEDEIEASAKRARREVLATVERTAPAWTRREAAASGSTYRTF